MLVLDYVLGLLFSNDIILFTEKLDFNFKLLLVEGFGWYKERVSCFIKVINTASSRFISDSLSKEAS